MKCPGCGDELKTIKECSTLFICDRCLRSYNKKELEGKCEFCENPSTGFYVLYEWDEELQLNVSIAGAQLCNDCKEKYGYDD